MFVSKKKFDIRTNNLEWLLKELTNNSINYTKSVSDNIMDLCEKFEKRISILESKNKNIIEVFEDKKRFGG